MRAQRKLLSNKWAGISLLTFLLVTLLYCKADDDTVPLNADQLPGLEYLGRGYDFFGEYADVSAVKSPLIELKNFVREVNAYGIPYAIPENVDFILYNKNEINSIYGQDIREYQENLSISAGVKVKYLGFKASVKTNFAQQYYTHEDFQFATVKNLVSRWRLSLPFDVQTLQGMLTTEAAADLEYLEPAALFSKYGHFMLTEAVIGARVDYSASARRTQEYSSDNFQLYARASYNWAVGNLSVDVSSQYGQTLQTFRSQAQINLITKGGASQYGQSILEGDYSPWIESIRDNPVLCDFTQRSLLPIWELCQNPARKAELEQYFEQLNGENELPPLTKDPLLITDIKIMEVPISDETTISADDPLLAEFARRQVPGYTVLQDNINNDGCSSALFLAYKEEKQSITNTGYSDLYVNYVGPGLSPLSGYIKFIPNLNYTCGKGDSDLLYKPWNNQGNPIRGLMIKVTDDDDPGVPPEGYVWVLSDFIAPANLDWKLVGKKKFLAYTTEVNPNGVIWKKTTTPK
ncbi:MAG: MAC/perforin domain-containing protein [Saprospiraceae bacterium]